MVALSPKILELRQLLDDRFGRPPPTDSARFFTGLPALDEIGLPSAAISELVADPLAGPGATLLLYGLLHATLGKGERAMLIDGRDSFAPRELPQAELNRLLWVRCREAWEAIKAADLAVRDGNLPLVVLLLALNPTAELRRIPATVWHRLQMLAEKSSVTLLVFTPQAQIGCARLRLAIGGAFPMQALHRVRGDLLPGLNLAWNGAVPEKAMKNYAVLFAPEFRLQALLRHTPALAGNSAALVEMDGTKSRVMELNASARSFRVERGMTPTQALARCPGLRLLHANAGREDSAREILLQTAETLSPFLESTQPGVVTVELPGERSFAEADLRAGIVVPLHALGLESRVGIAATPDLALLAARLADPVRIVREASAFLDPLPVDVLQPGLELSGVLGMWGIRTIGQLVALPRGPTCERLGPESIGLWERASGGRARPLRLVRAPEQFVEQADLEHPVETLEPLLFLLRRFLDQIVARLGQVYLAAGRLRLTLRFEPGDAYRHLFTIPQPTCDVGLLFRMLHTHLENFSSASPVVGVELAALPVRPGREQFGLFERGLRDPHQFAETLARLHALLGPDRVGTPEIEASHHPDAFHLRAPDPHADAPAGDAEILLGVPWLRFRPPVPANVVLNEAQPAFLYSTRSTGPIREARGPWLLEGDWWERTGWSRREWDIATDDGVYRLVQAERDWFLDGIYG